MIEIRWRTASPGLVFQLPQYVSSFSFSLRHLLFHRRTRKQLPIVGDGVDLVTIVFKDELFLLRLQARSLALFLDPKFDGSIIVIVNDLDLTQTMKAIRRVILPEYGRWKDRVRLVPFHHVGFRLDPCNGWILQQALKLAVSTLIDKKFYVLLDAKNHLIRNVSADRFVTSKGKGIQTLEDDFVTLPAHYETCIRYFGLDPGAIPIRPCSPITPFVMHTKSVRDLIDHIESKENRSLCSVFCETRFLSEFLLYRVYLYFAYKDGDELPYQDGPLLSQTIWRDEISVKNAIDKIASEPDLLFFAVHRERIKRLEAEEMVLIDALWRQRGLLGESETLEQIGDEMKRAGRKSRRLRSGVQTLRRLFAA